MAPDWTAYCEHSERGAIVHASVPFLDLLGYTAAELSSGSVPSLIDLTPAEHHTLDARQYQLTAATASPTFWIKPLRHRNGRHILVSVGVRFTPPDRYLSIFFPITPNSDPAGSFTTRILQREDNQKQHLARKLHDTTAQNLAAISINLSLLPTLPRDDPRAQQLISECTDLTSDCLSEVRAISYRLHPPLLEELGLPGALRAYAQSYSRHTGIDLQLDTNTFPRPPKNVELAIFRLIEERLGYLEQHGDPTESRIELHSTPDSYQITIWDNGDPDVASSEDEQAELRLSIGILHERSTSVGATLTIENHSRSTTIRAIIARS